MEKKELQKELEQIEVLEKRIEASLANAPKGSMRCNLAKGKYPQFYVVEEGKTYIRGQYIRKKDIALAKKYAQKEYDELVLDFLKKQKCAIRNGLMIEDECAYGKQFQKIAPAKRCLIQPYFPNEESYLLNWEASFRVGENSIPITNGYETEKGETVRSKSEKMIADKLYKRNIPYIYEPTLKLKPGVTIFPDFVMLNIRTRKSVYLEHFGMMDTPEYCKGALEKIEKYESAGIFIGEKLLVMFESSQKGINIKVLDALIDKYLL